MEKNTFSGFGLVSLLKAELWFLYNVFNPASSCKLSYGFIFSYVDAVQLPDFLSRSSVLVCERTKEKGSSEAGPGHNPRL